MPLHLKFIIFLILSPPKLLTAYRLWHYKDELVQLLSSSSSRICDNDGIPHHERTMLLTKLCMIALKGNFALTRNILLVTCSRSMFSVSNLKAQNLKVTLHHLARKLYKATPTESVVSRPNILKI